MVEDHRIIALIKKTAGGTMADNISDQNIIDEFIHLSPLERSDMLMRLDEQFGDGADMRQDAQLLAIRRGWREADLKMRKVGR
jgi:hypothetical protein